MEKIIDFNVVLTGQSEEIEKRFEPICQELNSTPIKIDRGAHELELQQASMAYSLAESAARKSTGVANLRPNATADCRKYLLAKGANLWKKTPGGELSVDASVLQGLAPSHPEVWDILAAREALSKKSQLKKWEEFVQQEVVQPKWNQFGTPVGRLSCSDPALQNRIMEIRKTVVAPQGTTFLSFDGSQMEYRTWANLSGDPTLKSMFQTEGVDFHTEMGLKLAKYLREGTNSRKAGKTINFALLYRMRAASLANDLGISYEDAEAIINEYRRDASVAEEYTNRIISQALKDGFVTTYFGRKRYLPELLHTDPKVQRDAVKTAWHHHNAGTAAELFKWVMCEVDDNLKKEGLKNACKWVINMHDEAILQVSDWALADATAVVAGSIKNPVEDWVPFKYSLTTAHDWASLDS